MTTQRTGDGRLQVTVTAGQTTNLPFTTVDICGDWPTFGGGGPSAF